MRFLVSALIAITLVASAVASALPALAEQRENHETSHQPERKKDYLTTRPVQDHPVDHLGLSAIYAADIFQESLAVVGRPQLVAEGPAKILTSAERDSLTFEPSTEVERATRHKLLASLLKTTQTPQVQDEIRQTIRSDDIWRQFDGVLNKAGFSSSNLADVTAAYYILAWEVVNTNDSSADAKTIGAVRDAVAAGMANDGRLARMSDAEKQQAASVMAYMVTIAADSVNELNHSGNQDALVRLRAQVHDNIMAQGVDLDRLKLTDRGFARR